MKIVAVADPVPRRWFEPRTRAGKSGVALQEEGWESPPREAESVHGANGARGPVSDVCKSGGNSVLMVRGLPMVVMS